MNNVSELKKIQKILSGLEKSKKLKPIQIIPSIESAEGVVNSYPIASFGKRVTAIVFGIFDLLNDLVLNTQKMHQVENILDTKYLLMLQLQEYLLLMVFGKI